MSNAPSRFRPFRLLKIAAITVVGAYVGLVVVAFLTQRSLIYRPERLSEARNQGTKDGGTIVRFQAPGGPRVSGLWFPPRDADAPVVLVFHGNGGSIRSWQPALLPWTRRGFGGLLVDPRGYGLSEGEPTEEGFHADGAAALAWLEKEGVPASRVIVEGISLGAGIAVPLAANHRVRGLVVQSAFTSLPDAASATFWFLPCELLLRDRYDNVAAAPRVSCPVLILHGTEDVLVPVEQASRLASAFPRPPTLRIVAGYDHNRLSEWPGLDAVLAAFAATLR